MKKNTEDKVPIYKLETTEEIMKYYDEWGNSYDQDMIEWNYAAPKVSVNSFKKYAQNKSMSILDAGCGTGLVGIELKKNNYINIDGLDLSKKLLDLIPKGYYKNLAISDLNKPLNIKDNFYDAIICVGTFTYGHVKNNAFDEFIRITKDKGLICFTINEGVYKKNNFDIKIKELTESGCWKIKEFFKSEYIVNKDVNAWLGIAEVTKEI
mgnify:CR=1 FL=1|tara:strand:- start:7424 stop:8050 length:627 start_codon:yes stop_codon:yes gene_type:complete